MSEKLLHNETLVQEDLLDYKNPKLPVEKRLEDLLKQMTLEEKVAQMLCIWAKRNIG
jgi:beta-glucosidase